MPILDAKFLETDREGASLLKSVLDTGRRGRRRKVAGFAPLREEQPAEPVRLQPVLAEHDDEQEMHPAVLATFVG